MQSSHGGDSSATRDRRAKSLFRARVGPDGRRPARASLSRRRVLPAHLRAERPRRAVPDPRVLPGSARQRAGVTPLDERRSSTSSNASSRLSARGVRRRAAFRRHAASRERVASDVDAEVVPRVVRGDVAARAAEAADEGVTMRTTPSPMMRHDASGASFGLSRPSTNALTLNSTQARRSIHLRAQGADRRPHSHLRALRISGR